MLRSLLGIKVASGRGDVRHQGSALSQLTVLGIATPTQNQGPRGRCRRKDRGNVDPELLSPSNLELLTHRRNILWQSNLVFAESKISFQSLFGTAFWANALCEHVAY